MLTIEQVRESLRKAVALKGEDYVYPTAKGCRYADPDTGEPSCLVGYVLADLAPEEFARLRARERASRVSPAARRAIPMMIAMPSSAIMALDSAQAEQDRAAPWGQAMARFEATLSELSGEPESGRHTQRTTFGGE